MRRIDACHPTILVENRRGFYSCHAYVEQTLAAHKVDGIRQALGASLTYLPPNSPDLNPVKRLFAKLKALLRKAATRTKDELWSRSAACSRPCHSPNVPAI